MKKIKRKTYNSPYYKAYEENINILYVLVLFCDSVNIIKMF